jgi:hypothetical protein
MTFKKTGGSLMSFWKFSHMFHELSSTDCCHSSTPTQENLCQMDEEVKETVTNWLNGLAANFYVEGIVKLVQSFDKCLNRNWDYVDKHTLYLVVILQLLG